MAVGLGIAELCRKWWCHLDIHSCGRVSMGICWVSKTLSRQESVVMKYALTYKGRLNSKTMLPGAVAGTDKV